MKSKASIKGHPIHPILIAFPIAFFVGSFVFDILSLALHRDLFWITGYYCAIAGVIGGLAAAIPGTIDYFNTIPPKSSGKKRGTQHAIINVLNLLLFVAVIYCKRTGNFSSTLIIAIEAVGMILLGIAGWLGGTLVYRNQIGVDPRYANAGKWKEITINNTNASVADSNELQVNQMKLVHYRDKRIVIARSEKGYVAFDDHCTHRGGSLAGGSMMCGTVQCPWHGSQFDVQTGEVKAGPAKEAISAYSTEERNGKIYLTNIE